MSDQVVKIEKREGLIKNIPFEGNARILADGSGPLRVDSIRRRFRDPRLESKRRRSGTHLKAKFLLPSIPFLPWFFLKSFSFILFLCADAEDPPPRRAVVFAPRTIVLHHRRWLCTTIGASKGYLFFLFPFLKTRLVLKTLKSALLFFSFFVFFYFLLFFVYLKKFRSKLRSKNFKRLEHPSYYFLKSLNLVMFQIFERKRKRLLSLIYSCFVLTLFIICFFFKKKNDKRIRIEYLRWIYDHICIYAK